VSILKGLTFFNYVDPGIIPKNTIIPDINDRYLFSKYLFLRIQFIKIHGKA